MNIKANKKLYKITLLESKEVKELPEDFDRLEDSFFESNDNLTAFVFDTGDDLLNILTNYATKHSIPYKVDDISEKALFGQYNDEKFKEVFVDSLTIFGEPLTQLNIWRESNLDVNDVLDKISKYGINSLDLIDKKILGKF